MTNPHKTHFSNIHVNIVMYILKQNPKKKTYFDYLDSGYACQLTSNIWTK